MFRRQFAFVSACVLFAGTPVPTFGNARCEAYSLHASEEETDRLLEKYAGSTFVPPRTRAWVSTLVHHVSANSAAIAKIEAAGGRGVEALIEELTQAAPDTGAHPFSDWRGGYRGTIEGLIRTNSFRAYSGIDLPYREASLSSRGQQNENWSFVGRVLGEHSRDPLAKRFPGRRTAREFYWTTEQAGEANTEIAPYGVRVAVNIVDGVEVDLEVFARNDRGDWLPARYERENGKWARRWTDHEGKPIYQACVKCHGSGPDFGPTPKGLADFKRPPGWFRVESPKNPGRILDPYGYTGPFREPGDQPPP